MTRPTRKPVRRPPELTAHYLMLVADRVRVDTVAEVTVVDHRGSDPSTGFLLAVGTTSGAPVAQVDYAFGAAGISLGVADFVGATRWSEEVAWDQPLAVAQLVDEAVLTIVRAAAAGSELAL